MLYDRASAVVSFPYVDGSYNLDVRAFIFTLGGSVGYRHVWRNHTFARGTPFSQTGRDARVQREKDEVFDDAGFPYWEGRLRATIPLDSFFMLNTATLRGEDQKNNTFDWYHGDIHDGGTYFKYDGVLFYRHRDFGAIGPTVRYTSYKREGQPLKQPWAFGFTVGTRPAWKKGTDLLLLQVLMKPGDDQYGTHAYHAPITVLGVYRATVRF